MRIELPYGNDTISATLGPARPVEVLELAEKSAPDPAEAIVRALASPVGQDGTLRQRVKPYDKVVVLVSDQSRKTRADLVLPILLDELTAGGICERDVSILFATGTHRAPTTAEQEKILGAPIYERLRPRVFVHDAFDRSQLVSVGTTSRGTPVQINRLAIENDRLIATGSVVLHYFGGFGGGRKSVVPGIAGAETIAHNHAMNLHPRDDTLDPAVRIGVLNGNPVAEDMLEAARLVPVDSIINTVLDREGRIAGVFAGELDAAHRAAAQLAREMFVVPLTRQADVVIASAGDAANFVQAHKALYNAWQAMKPGGRIVFVARCAEGPGGEQFTKWLRLGSREKIIAALRRQSDINGQTALSTLEKAPSAVFVTDMPDEAVALLGAKKAPSLEAALALAFGELSQLQNPHCCLMPHASYTVPAIG